MTSDEEFNRTLAAYQDTELEACETNRTAVFTTLEQLKITALSVEFDGVGDDGGITRISAYRGKRQIKLPKRAVQTALVVPSSEPSIRPLALEEAIESLCCDMLATVQAGWEIDEGAYGEFVLTVATRSIHLEFNSRYLAVETSTYDL